MKRRLSTGEKRRVKAIKKGGRGDRGKAERMAGGGARRAGKGMKAGGVACMGSSGGGKVRRVGANKACPEEGERWMKRRGENTS